MRGGLLRASESGDSSRSETRQHSCGAQRASKLLDFGIARILDETERSQTRERMLSPDFASPEQVRGAARSTATDVYSLGATLYTLLTTVRHMRWNRKPGKRQARRAVRHR